MFIPCSDKHFYWANIRLFVNNILTVQTHNVRNILLTADYFNNIAFILVAKINATKNFFFEKMETN